MSGIAMFVRYLTDWQSDARLYQVTPPITYRHLGEDTLMPTDYVIVSAISAPLTGPETYMFPATEAGEAINHIELDGSFRGALDHELALVNAGYELEQTTPPR